MDPLDLERLAVRIEILTQHRTHDWDDADAMEFRSWMPGSHSINPGRRKLPDPANLRLAAANLRLRQSVGADEKITVSPADYRLAMQRCLHLEGLVTANRPHNPRRIMRDMAPGRLPGLRR